MISQYENIIGMRKKIDAQADHIRRLEIRIHELRTAQAQHSVPVAREQLERLVRILDAHNYAKDAEALMALLAAAPAQAQHSVPEGLALIPVRETEAMHDAVMALLYKGVARTDTQKLLDAYIAAAPGKEGV
ncbi:TPA: hypothetical protein ACGPN7_002096 [Pseudomonas aeruginosa]|nr:hypothetical protein [Pseudomonas aeruginosa]